MRKLVLLAAATAAASVPLLGSLGGGTASADRHCYTPHVAGFDSYEVCYYLPIEPTTHSDSTVLAQSLVPQLPDPTDCHSMNKFLHIDNVRSCDGDPSS